MSTVTLTNNDAARRENPDAGLRHHAPRPDHGPRAVLLATRLAWIRRTGRARRANGARDGHRAGLGDEGGDARGHRDLPVTARPARDPGRDLALVSAWRLLGRVGRRVGVHPSELRHRRDPGRALRPLWRPALGH